MHWYVVYMAFNKLLLMSHDMLGRGTYVWLFSVEYNFCEFHDFDIELQKY